MPNPEELNSTPETVVDTSETAGERLEQLLKTAEKAPESESNAESHEKTVENAKEKAMEAAIGKEKGSAEKDRKQPPSRKRHGTISKREKENSFKRHMATVQSQLSLPQRAFSKVIHNKAVEKTSEFVGSTVARPNAILSGSVFAFFLVLGVYALAKYFGYVLSGFETIGAFIVGWVLGVVYDYIRLLIVGRR